MKRSGVHEFLKHSADGSEGTSQRHWEIDTTRIASPVAWQRSRSRRLSVETRAREYPRVGGEQPRRTAVERSLSSTRGRLERLRSRSPSVFSCVMSVDEQRDTNADLKQKIEELEDHLHAEHAEKFQKIRNLEEAKYAKHLLREAHEQHLAEVKRTRAEKCSIALARLLECLSHTELGDATVDKPKRRGSWKATLRAASGKFFFILRDLLEESIDSIPEPASEGRHEKPEGKSARKIGNEMHVLQSRHAPTGEWSTEHVKLLDRRICNKLSFGGSAAQSWAPNGSVRHPPWNYAVSG